ncbi:MAG: hypothetical protein JXR05_11815 [Flavobacteriaceae bacterium]
MKKLLILLILIVLIPIIFIGFSRDASVYAYMGKLLVDGYIPYVDGWDHKGISLYFINAFGYLIGFKSFIGIRVLELILILYAFSKAYKILSVKFSKLIVFIACVFGLFTLKYFFDDGNMTEEYGAIFSLIAISLLLKENIRTLDYGIVGALFIINLTIRANLISFWVALFLMYVIQVILKVIPVRTFLLNLLKMAYGGAVIVLLLLIYLFSTGSFQEFIDAAFVFNFSYSDTTFVSTLEVIFRSMKRYHLSILFVIAFVLSLIRFYKDKTKTIELLLIFWIPIELYFGNMSNRMYAHYFLMWAPILVLSSCIIFSTLKEQLNASNQKLIIISGVLFVLCFYIPTYMVLKDWKEIVIKPKTTFIENVSNHIAKNYEDESLLVWGNYCQFYNNTGKKAPTTFFYQSIFKYKSDLVKEKAKEFTKEILENKPGLIVDAKGKGLLNLNGGDEIKIDDSQKEYLKEFLSIVRTHYILKEQKYGADFYILKENE